MIGKYISWFSVAFAGSGLIVMASFLVGSTSYLGKSAFAGADLIPVKLPPPPRVTDRLYQLLAGEVKDVQVGLSTLVDDIAWRPSEVDIAKAVQVLPSLSDADQLQIIWLMHRDPKVSARWMDTLVNYTGAKGFVDSEIRLHVFYFELFNKFARAAPSCLVEDQLARLWQVRDWSFSKEWVSSAASFGIPGWTDRFREWKKRLPKSFIDANGDFIKEISEKADKYDQR